MKSQGDYNLRGEQSRTWWRKVSTPEVATPLAALTVGTSHKQGKGRIRKPSVLELSGDELLVVYRTFP